ncbi:MAG TPA: DUF3617 family protein [Candidatus Koribacter sp.]|jgi:hypothetical protein
MRVLIVFTFLAITSVAASAQAAPVKMGLWEKTMTTSTGSGAPTTSKSRSCVTPEEWKEMDANVTRKRQGCTAAAVRNAKGYTFNSTCTIGATTMVINGSTTIPDAEHIVTESHTTMTINGEKKQTDSHSVSRFVSADCGKVQPGEPEEVN